MDSAAQLITQPEMVIVFVSIILGVALRPFYQAFFSIGAVNEDLNKATRIVSEFGKNQDEFYDQFKTINAHLLKIPGLRHAWREFVDSMYFETAAQANMHRKAYISHRPAHYFNRESVLGPRLNLSQFFAYPNYLIGIGLTFTFIGLAAALHVAQAGLASGAGQQALKDLLAVASVKFISSIVGIASSLIISAIQRIRIRLFQQKLDAFCDLLEESTKYKSTEKLLHDSLAEQRRQTAHFGDMAATIAAGIAQHIGSGVERAMEPVTHDLRNLGQQFTAGSEHTLAHMLSEFTQQLRTHSETDLHGLMQNVHRLSDSLSLLATDTRSSATQLLETSTHFANAFTPFENNITQLGASLSALESTASNMMQASYATHNSAAEFATTISAISAHLTHNQEEIHTLLQRLREYMERGSLPTSKQSFWKRRG